MRPRRRHYRRWETLWTTPPAFGPLVIRADRADRADGLIDGLVRRPDPIVQREVA